MSVFCSRARMVHLLKKSASEMRIARAPSITKGYPLPEGSPGWLIATRVLEGRINFRAFSSAHHPRRRLFQFATAEGTKVLQSLTTEAGPRVEATPCLAVKGKRISCPPQYALLNNDGDSRHHHSGHGFPLIRSPRASTQPSTSVLFSFVLSLLIVAGSFATRQSKMIGARSLSSGRGGLRQQIVTSLT